MGQEVEETKGWHMKVNTRSGRIRGTGSRVEKLHEFDGGGTDRTGASGRENAEWSLKVIKYHGEYHSI